MGILLTTYYYYQVNDKFVELTKLWEEIKESAALRKQKLEENFKYYKFLVSIFSFFSVFT